MSKINGKRPPMRLHNWSDKPISESDKAGFDDAIWLALISQKEEFKTRLAVPPLVKLFSESNKEQSSGATTRVDEK